MRPACGHQFPNPRPALQPQPQPELRRHVQIDNWKILPRRMRAWFYLFVYVFVVGIILEGYFYSIIVGLRKWGRIKPRFIQARGATLLWALTAGYVTNKTDGSHRFCWLPFHCLAHWQSMTDRWFGLGHFTIQIDYMSVF